jgi:hypothetical protein
MDVYPSTCHLSSFNHQQRSNPGVIAFEIISGHAVVADTGISLVDPEGVAEDKIVFRRIEIQLRVVWPEFARTGTHPKVVHTVKSRKMLIAPNGIIDN